MILVLIRHGRTMANEKRLYCGKTDLGLSEKGMDELKSKKNHELRSFDMSAMRVITSGMKRCEQTLKLLFGDILHETDPAFREMDFGDFEMRSYEEMKNDPDYIAWISGDNGSNVTPNGESGKMMQARVLEGLGRLISEERDTLLVTHGGVIVTLMTHLFPEENKSFYEWQPAPGDGYLIDVHSHKYLRIPDAF